MRTATHCPATRTFLGPIRHGHVNNLSTHLGRQLSWTRLISHSLENESGGNGGSGDTNAGSTPPGSGGSGVASGPRVGGGSSSFGGESDQGSAPRVCILGGGFGGLYTAIKLDQLMWPKGKKPRVTLVDQQERFSFKPLLYDVLVGSASRDEVAPLYSNVLGSSSVTFVHGSVSGVEEGEKRVVMTDGGTIAYDWLVMALGARTNSFGVPGVKEYAMEFSTYDDAVKLKEELAKFGPDDFPELCIVGGGYAGVELAASLVDMLQGMCRIRIVTSGGDILENAPDGQRMAAKKVLENDGVSVVYDTMVEKIQLAGGDKRILQTRRRESSTAEVVEADIVVWTAGQSPAVKSEELEKYIPFRLNEYGAMETDRTLKVLDTDGVFALGDVAITHSADAVDRPLPLTAQVALQQADYVAWNIWASINNKPLLNFRYQHLGNMMSLGSTRGAVSVPIPVPPPISAAIKSGPVGDFLKAVGVSVETTYGGASDGVTIQGPLGALLRRAAYFYRQPTDSQRLNIVSSWAQLAQQNLTKAK